MTEEFTPRNYQEELMKIGLENNTIIFLPTGSGKTFIALMILKQMSGSLLTSYLDGGKITIILVNTIALVDQHSKYITDHTNLTVGQYTGEMNPDFWPREQWYTEFNRHQVLIMTSQILVNLVNNNYMDLNRVNLLIFDECHRGVNDHSMRQLMKKFGSLVEPPRVIGLTATLLNGNCKVERVMQAVLDLETTYHSKVATVDGLDKVVGYSTNPKEDLKICGAHNSTYHETIAINVLDRTINILKVIRAETKQTVTSLRLEGLKPLQPADGYRDLWNLVSDLRIHIETMGSFGGLKATLSHLIQVERLKKHCQDVNFFDILNFVQTSLCFVEKLLSNAMKGYDEIEQITRFSSDKVLQLINILREYKSLSKEELCCLIFTQRRFTAKVIFHILDALRQTDQEFAHIKPNFMVGYNNNPYNDTREGLFISKKNKQVLNSFANKEINVLVASNVLEEGVDIPKCTLVIKYDKPEDYRSYIQSKGRARHKDSLYYIIVERENHTKYLTKYLQFQEVEDTLNNYLVGKNKNRLEPSKEEIEKMYNEDELPPYYVDGPGTAQVNMQSAIPLLCQYCNSLPSDIYTTLTPVWYVKKKPSGDMNEELHSVVILLPTISPIIDLIAGPYMKSAKSAKRAAALKACEILHKAGELDDHLLPRKNVVKEEDVNFLFTHYPAVKEFCVGSSKVRRLYKKKIAQSTKGQIRPNAPAFLHVIHLTPQFKRSAETADAMMRDAYVAPLTYGLLTASPLPALCDSPIYPTLGAVTVSVEVNKRQVALTEEQILLARRFHLTVFRDVLKINHRFLVMDNDEDAETLLLVPIDRSEEHIDLDSLGARVRPNVEPSKEEKAGLQVTEASHLGKIVTLWYRTEPPPQPCIVTNVCRDLDALSLFPDDAGFNGTFRGYFEHRYGLAMVNARLPLLQAKHLTKRKNFVRPVGREAKRKRDRVVEERPQHLPPELVVKQEFPTSLWIQANFLPTVLSRTSHLLQVEELRQKVAREAGLGRETVTKKKPLQLDEFLLKYDAFIDEDTETDMLQGDRLTIIPPFFWDRNQNLVDAVAALLEAQYPWAESEEPKDVERDLFVSIHDVERYETFIAKNPVVGKMAVDYSSIAKQHALEKKEQKRIATKTLALLDTHLGVDGPELCDLYRALTAAKANDIVNYERLETLGDSFLKLISSVYISLRFPHYDEGRATSLKSRLVSNKNLYYLAVRKDLGGIMKFNELSPEAEWLPTGFTIPRQMLARIEAKELSLRALHDLRIPLDEQVSGELSAATVDAVRRLDVAPDDAEELCYHNRGTFLKSQYIGDKHVADVVESLLGAYLSSCGILGGIKFVEWMGIIPASEDLAGMLRSPPMSPILNKDATQANVDYHLSQYRDIERILGYRFRNRAYLLQALTHASYTPNRITLSYEKLEFLGDAILDFLITCHIYESCGNLNPGQLTDLRSALVNNNTFASLVVRNGLHKFLLMINSTLQGMVDKFVGIMEKKQFQIDEQVLILLEEQDYNMAESVDVPKILGDVFEALAGAVYLDSNKNLKTVWEVFYRLMAKEIDLFSKDVPMNIIRRIFECKGAEPKFGESKPLSNRKVMVPLQFTSNGSKKIVHGFGSNKVMAKKAAAKMALRFLEER